MFKKFILSALILSALALASCGGSPEVPTATATVVVSPTIDACLPQYKIVIADRVNLHMREFDDASTLASSLNKDALPGAVSELQRIRRVAENEPVPSCLDKLKSAQVAHMNAVINTLMGFLNSAPAAELQNGINEARKLHDEYAVELASVLGVTVVVKPTSAATAPPAATQATGLSILNPGPDAVIMYASPDLAAGGVATLAAGQTAVAFGQTADAQWVQAEIPGVPGQKAWVSAALVQVSGQLPVVNP